ncbi:hypothetical protein GQ43DRAFT_376998 [Delitschia confertaspora ATCC 74209]|uniref:Uncharacterized protein n=1 Tax=Delitschia confertaspora ATCC 74209 TaxID=1513339 RepID=A0A9P4JGR8_9PLEO|nr:hypothetical protein GQ43DRAFT_376998 [Delitschia confertaspora ATCC 74209]
MHSEVVLSTRSDWMSRVRSALRLLIIILSSGVIGLLAHTITIYRGNWYLDLRNGELPMSWPAKTNLIPTIILLSVASTNVLVSFIILALSFMKSFRRPVRYRDVYRILAGTFGIALWGVALGLYSLLNGTTKASLARYSCANWNVMSNGRYQYRKVCEEQASAIYIASAAAFAEGLMLLTLAVSSFRQTRRRSSHSSQEKPLMSGASSGRPS